MDPRVPVDRARALRQWEALRDTYRELGHRVDELPPGPACRTWSTRPTVPPCSDGIVLGARFRHRERRAEAAAHRQWFAAAGFSGSSGPGSSTRARATCWSPAAPDDRVLLAGTGFRTDPRAHAEAAAVLGCPVLPLELVDPRYYHLDTALAVLDADTVAWLPEAFAPPSRELLAARFPDAVVADRRTRRCSG